MVINIIGATILTIAIITIIMAVSHRKENIIFIAIKVVTLASIQMMNNRRQKSFKNKNKNFAKINANTIHFWLIMKRILIITLIMTMKKQIIWTTMTKTLLNLILERIISTNKGIIGLERWVKR